MEHPNSFDITEGIGQNNKIVTSEIGQIKLFLVFVKNIYNKLFN